MFFCSPLVGGHNSREDATACMELILWKVKEDNKRRKWWLLWLWRNKMGGENHFGSLFSNASVPITFLMQKWWQWENLVGRLDYIHFWSWRCTGRRKHKCTKYK